MIIFQYLNYGRFYLPWKMTDDGSGIFRVRPRASDPKTGFAATFVFTIFGFGLCCYDVSEEGYESSAFVPAIKNGKLWRSWTIGRFAPIKQAIAAAKA